MKRAKIERTYTDPVCGMKLSQKTAAEELEYMGQRYFFCADICREAFEGKPEKYIRRHRQHGVDRS